MTAVRKSVRFGDHDLVLETGKIARQASGAVIVSLGDTSILVTVVGNRRPADDRGFFPLTVDYQEKTYAAGKIPGGFFKREGRPSEKETLTARLIDRPLRPSFPDGFRQEVQVIATVMSLDPEIDPDIPALVGASAAIAISGLPFNGPIGAVRVGYVDGQFVLNPARSILAGSDLDLIVAGTADAVLMVESEANGLSESTMLDAVMFGHEQSRLAINLINELAAETRKEPWEIQIKELPAELVAEVAEVGSARISECYTISDKLERYTALDEARGAIAKEIAGDGEEPRFNPKDIDKALHNVEKNLVRRRIIDGHPRIDGRDPQTVRQVETEVGILPRTHGSALFTRGETQALVTTTLGSGRDAQIIDALEGERRDPFMLHYNFPPFCVGETGRVGSPRRREIGHGRLARRGIAAVMPDMETYPYVIRVVSEITESNGSSSMASVCGTSLALMDAGVPIKAPVAGIAMGLIKEGDEFVVLSDILGDEDHLGDMDFKVAGSAEGITALQMDIKIGGITRAIMETALKQALDGRLTILAKMAESLDAPRPEMSEYAPRIITFKIHPEKIRDVIGKGGSTIRSITEETGTTIDITDDGTVKIASVEKSAGVDAQRRIEQITADVEVGMIYDGKVIKLMDFGAFVNILPGKDGLVHISQICEERVERVSDKLTEGDIVKVKVLEVDKQGRIRLSMKAIAAA